MLRSGPSPPAEAPGSPGLVLIHAGFVLTGMVTTLLGPILPWLAARWSLDDLHAGYLFTAQFVGSIAGVGASSWLVPHRGFRVALLFGFGLMGAGVAVLSLGPWAVGLGAATCYGIGLGLTIPSTNLLIAETNPKQRAAALNLLNLAWGAGAVAFPPAAAIALRSGGTRPLLLGLAGTLAIVLLLLARSSFALLDQKSATAAGSLESRRAIWKCRLIPVICLLLFLYVGTENALAGWVASYAQRLSAPPGTVWAVTPSFFWGTLLLGRAVAPAVLRRVAEAMLARLGLLLAALGVAVILSAGTLTGVACGASLAGLGLATVFPITVALLAHRFGTGATRVAGPMFASAGLGGATLPWLVGFSSGQFGSLKAGLVVPLLGSLAMLALYMRYVRSTAPGSSLSVNPN